MKNITYLLALILSMGLVYSQDTEPSLWQFKWGFSDSYRVFAPDSFKQNSVLTGFQWSGSLKMNNALKNNSRAGMYYQEETESVNIPLQLIHQPYWADASDYRPGYWFSVVMQYEPTLPLTSL